MDPDPDPPSEPVSHPEPVELFQSGESELINTQTSIYKQVRHMRNKTRLQCSAIEKKNWIKLGQEEVF